MPKTFRPSSREASILSKIETSKALRRRRALSELRNFAEVLSGEISMKLIDSGLIETTSKNALEEEILKCIEKLGRSEDFDIDYRVSPFRNIVKHPHIVSLYITSYIIEHIINHKAIVDIFGTDEEIYNCVNRQVQHYLPIQ